MSPVFAKRQPGSASAFQDLAHEEDVPDKGHDGVLVHSTKVSFCQTFSNLRALEMSLIRGVALL